MPVNEQPQMSIAEIDRMRDILAQQDARRTPNVFDLSKPPIMPYTHQKFPLLVYDAKASVGPRIIVREVIFEGRVRDAETHVAAKLVTKKVNSEAELAVALEDGWSQTPPTFKEVKPERVKTVKA